MEGPPSCPWAKVAVSQDNSVVTWHPLLDHCCDVGVCLATILNSLPVLRQRFAATGGLSDLDQIQRQRLALLAALHDIGKCNRGFQNRWRPHLSALAGHTSEALALLTDSSLWPHAKHLFQFQHLQRWVEHPVHICQLLAASFSHHGKPVSPANGVAKFWQQEGENAPLRAAEQIVSQCSEWFSAAFENTVEILPGNPEFQHMFCGLVTLADWIASDTRFFPFARSATEPRIDFAVQAAAEALKKLGMDTKGATTF
ncbi:MAG TPA: CRISPR-associated endonuclease Cas3'', partial [bacterium]|nr:CRISPR-associated endonuclease Cas3'' [bacterium]